MPKCIELLPCDWLISNLCFQAIEQVYLIKWPVSVCMYIYIYIYMYFFFLSFSRRFYPKRLTNEDITEAIKTNKRWIRILLLGLSWAGHSTRWEQLMKKSVKVILCLFGMVQ